MKTGEREGTGQVFFSSNVKTFAWFRHRNSFFKTRTAPQPCISALLTWFRRDGRYPVRGSSYLAVSSAIKVAFFQNKGKGTRCLAFVRSIGLNSMPKGKLHQKSNTRTLVNTNLACQRKCHFHSNHANKKSCNKYAPSSLIRRCLNQVAVHPAIDHRKGLCKGNGELQGFCSSR